MAKTVADEILAIFLERGGSAYYGEEFHSSNMLCRQPTAHGKQVRESH
jgi:hypothetical protein